MSYSLLSGLITNLYNKTTPASEKTENIEDKIKLLNQEIEKLENIEITDFVDKIAEMIKNIRLAEISRELDNFKLYFHNLLKEFSIDTSKSTFLEIEELEKKRKKIENLEDTETVKVFKIIMNDYKSIIDNDQLNLDKVQAFAKFLNRDINTYDAKMYIKFIKYGNNNGGWRNYNYNNLPITELI